MSIHCENTSRYCGVLNNRICTSHTQGPGFKPQKPQIMITTIIAPSK